jgi:hypothetical protein
MGKKEKSASPAPDPPTPPEPPSAPPPEAPSKKSTAAEVARRVDEVLRVILDGAQFHDIVQFSSEQGWNVTERQLHKYIARANELLVERQDKSRKQLIARRLAQREALFGRAVNAADLRTALAVLDSADKLRGLFPDSNLKELVKLAAAQGTRIEELEKRIRDAHPSTDPPPPTEAPSPPPRPVAGGDADPNAI